MVHAAYNDDPLRGFTESEREGLKGFKELLSGTQNRSVYQELSSCDTRDGCDDDVTILRFLRGRSLNVEGAFQQFQEATEIRRAADAVKTYNMIDINDFEQTRNIYPHWTGRRDKSGRPICFFDLKHLDHHALSRYTTSQNMTEAVGGAYVTNGRQQALAFHDYLTRFVLPLCEAAADRASLSTTLTMSAVYLVDIHSFSLRQAWSLKNYAQDVSQLLATCYPETIERVYVLNGSTYFGKIWNFLSKWIDPRTASKLVIVPQGEVLPTLLSTINVEDVPVQLGGNFKFQHGLSPHLDEATARAVSLEDGAKLPLGPIKWVVNEEGEKSLTAVGTVTGCPRNIEVASII